MPDADQQRSDRERADRERADRERAVPSAELIARARAYRDVGGSPSPAKASATVILLRDRPGDGPGQLEVFMIRRHTGMLFAGGMYVFPGGVVDVADHTGRDHAQAHAFAAIRETFEECGVLLASGPELDATTLEAERLAMIEHHGTFDEVLARHRSVAQPDLLRVWSRWITPDFEPRRYDTYFYVALAPTQADARFVGGEADAAQWVAPELALAAQERGEWLLMPPTEWTLRELAKFTSAADVFTAANNRDLSPVQVRIDLDSEPPHWERWSHDEGGHRTMTTSKEQPTARAFLVRADNPSPMTLEGTNTWVLVEPGGDDAIVVDPGPDDATHREAIMVAVVAANAKRVALIALTHGHADHAEGAAALAQRVAAPVRAIAPTLCSPGQLPLSDGERLTIGGLHLEVIAAPGHTADSACFVVDADAALLTGDTILGRGSTVVARPDGSLAAYLATLHRLRALVGERELAVVLPGHGPVVDDPAAKIDAYLQHREERLEEVRAAANASDTVDEVLQRVYGDVTSELQFAARWSLLAQLDYLRDEGLNVPAE